MKELANAIFLVEGGKALELVKAHLEEVLRVRKQSQDLVREMDGVTTVWTDKTNGIVKAVEFPGERHPDFKKPTENTGSKPKKGTQWAQKFAAQVGYKNPADIIMEAFRIPGVLQYSGKRGGKGSCLAGIPGQEAEFLYLGENGPFAMVLPDIEAQVAQRVAEGETVEEPARSFKMSFEGCRRVSDEQWHEMVTEHQRTETAA